MNQIGAARLIGLRTGPGREEQPRRDAPGPGHGGSGFSGSGGPRDLLRGRRRRREGAGHQADRLITRCWLVAGRHLPHVPRAELRIGQGLLPEGASRPRPRQRRIDGVLECLSPAHTPTPRPSRVHATSHATAARRPKATRRTSTRAPRRPSRPPSARSAASTATSTASSASSRVEISSARAAPDPNPRVTPH